jgi:hypothetical protein
MIPPTSHKKLMSRINRELLQHGPYLLFLALYIKSQEPLGVKCQMTCIKEVELHICLLASVACEVALNVNRKIIFPYYSLALVSF